MRLAVAISSAGYEMPAAGEPLEEGLLALRSHMKRAIRGRSSARWRIELEPSPPWSGKSPERTWGRTFRTIARRRRTSRCASRGGSSGTGSSATPRCARVEVVDGAVPDTRHGRRSAVVQPDGVTIGVLPYEWDDTRVRLRPDLRWE